MPLEVLVIRNARVTDLSPLEKMSLREIEFDVDKASKGIEALLGMKSLTSINTGSKTLTPTEFWKRYDAGEFRAKPK